MNKAPLPLVDLEHVYIGLILSPYTACVAINKYKTYSEMPTSGDLKAGDFSFITSRHRTAQHSLSKEKEMKIGRAHV